MTYRNVIPATTHFIWVDVFPKPKKTSHGSTVSCNETWWLLGRRRWLKRVSPHLPYSLPPVKSMHFIGSGQRGLLVSSWPHSPEEAFSWMQTGPYAEWGGAYPARSLHKARGQCLWSQQQWFHSVLFQWGLWKAGHLYVRWFAAEFCVCSTLLIWCPLEFTRRVSFFQLIENRYSSGYGIGSP